MSESPDPWGPPRGAEVCRAKLRFSSRKAAKRWLKRFRRRHPRATAAVRPYQCPVCLEWHTTSQRRR